MKMLLILISVLLGSIGQVLFKMTMKGKSGAGLSMIETSIISIKSPFFWAGSIAYGLSLVVWMKVLADNELSFARPFAGFGYVLTALLASYFFSEHIGLMRWSGIVLIVLGIFLIAKS